MKRLIQVNSTANAAMIAIMASKLNPPLANSKKYFEWGKDQIHRILGLKGGRSYIIGYGKNYPLRPHHRSRFVFYCNNLSKN